VGTVVLAANQSGNANYNAATEVTTSFEVVKASQTIAAFATITQKTYGASAFAVTAPIATSGLAVTLSVKSGPATISGNTVTLTGVGTVVLAANQSGNANYNAATEVTTSFEVVKASQTIAAFATIPEQTYGGYFYVAIPNATSGLPVTLSVKSGPATISASTTTVATITKTGVGTVVLAANQAGNANYNAATEVTTSFEVALILVDTGINSSPSLLGNQHAQLGTPHIMRISSNGSTAFFVAQETIQRSVPKHYTNGAPTALHYNGFIYGLSWQNNAWTTTTSLSRTLNTQQGHYDTARNVLQISKDGRSVGFNFRYYNSLSSYEGIGVFGLYADEYYSYFIHNDDGNSDGFNLGPLSLPFAYDPARIYSPANIRFSDDASLHFVLFKSSSYLDQQTGTYYSRTNSKMKILNRGYLFFKWSDTNGGDVNSFEVSGDGNHIFVYINGSVKLYSYDGLSYVYVTDFSGTGTINTVNFDGSIFASKQTNGVKVFQKINNVWSQRGSILPNDTPFINSNGNLLNVGTRLYAWNGSDWVFQWYTLKSGGSVDNVAVLNDNGEIAVGVAGASSIKRYQKPVL
jgi:hypothetical protein